LLSIKFAPAIFICFLITIVFSCSKEEMKVTTYPELMEVPAHFGSVPQPEDNTFTLKRWTLGKKLFYDPLFSYDSTKSCASCHHQNFSFSDRVAFSEGVNSQKTTLNVPPLINLAYQPYYTGAGGVPTIEMQILVPIQEHNELNFNMPGIVKRVNQNSEYIQMAMDAYGRKPDAYVATRALACFERSLLSTQSEYDKYLSNQDESDLSAEALRGMKLFNSQRCGCSECHSGVNLTNYTFQNNGLYSHNPEDGRYRITLKDEDMGKFKVPTLRNVEYTAPYMHDGSIPTLEEVVRMYEKGGFPYPTKSPLIRGFQLTDQERNDLISFLKSLSDINFITNPIFKQE